MSMYKPLNNKKSLFNDFSEKNHFHLRSAVHQFSLLVIYIHETDESFSSLLICNNSEKAS